MFGDAYGEGINGHYYLEEMDFSGEYDSVCKCKRYPFVRNPLYYFHHLFGPHEEYRVVYETDKAVLFEVVDGRFWVPKALMRESRTLVHNSFRRSYLVRDGV